MTRVTTECETRDELVIHFVKRVTWRAVARSMHVGGLTPELSWEWMDWRLEEAEAEYQVHCALSRIRAGIDLARSAESL